jgi:hypothetical protein
VWPPQPDAWDGGASLALFSPEGPTTTLSTGVVTVNGVEGNPTVVTLRFALQTDVLPETPTTVLAEAVTSTDTAGGKLEASVQVNGLIVTTNAEPDSDP